MLEHQKWMYYPEDLVTEWKQAKDEGKDVDHLKAMCETVSKQPRSADFTAPADEIAKKIAEAPVVEGYPYTEPSALEDIRTARPVKRYNFTYKMADKTLRDKLSGTWTGRIAGCLLGKPVEGWRRERIEKLLTGTNNRPLARYMTANDFTPELIKGCAVNIDGCWADKIEGAAPVDDDTNYTVFALKLLETFGRDFRPADVLEAWLGWLPMLTTFTAERAAYRNAAMGLLPPQTAVYHNPFREWIGAQIRGDFFGYIHPSNPEAAAGMAWRDASVSHVKNGIYGEMFAAAMIAAAAASDDTRTVIEAGLGEIPEKSRLREAIEKVIGWYDQSLPYDEVMDHIHGLFDEADGHGWCHTIPNAMIVAAALLYGEKDFGKTVCLAVEAAFDTDCNGATAGSVLGMMLGAGGIPEYWSRPFHNRLLTSIAGYPEVTVEELVEKTVGFVIK